MHVVGPLERTRVGAPRQTHAASHLGQRLVLVLAFSNDNRVKIHTTIETTDEVIRKGGVSYLYAGCILEMLSVYFPLRLVHKGINLSQVGYRIGNLSELADFIEFNTFGSLQFDGKRSGEAVTFG